MRGHLEEVKGHLGESQARETMTREEMAKLEEELSEKTSLVGHLNTELQQLKKTVGQAKIREQKLARELEQVCVVDAVQKICNAFFPLCLFALASFTS